MYHVHNFFSLFLQKIQNRFQILLKYHNLLKNNNAVTSISTNATLAVLFYDNEVDKSYSCVLVLCTIERTSCVMAYSSSVGINRNNL
jgi:hypothetical protein